MKPLNNDAITSLSQLDESLYDVNAEAGVLSVLFLEGQSDKVNELREEYFYLKHNRQIFNAIKKLYDQNITVDLISVVSELMANSKDDNLLRHANEISDFVLGAAAFPHHLNILRKKYESRVLLNTFSVATDLIRKNTETEKIYACVMDRIVDLYRDNSNDSIVNVTKANMRVMSAVEEQIKDEGFNAMTGFSDLDLLTGGLGHKTLIILGGRPGMGKSVSAMCILLNNIINGVVCGLVNYEMSTEETTLRMLSNIARQPYTTMLRSMNNKDEEQIDRFYTSIAKAMDQISGLPLHQEDNPKGDLSNLRAIITKMANVHKCKLVVVDYLQLIEAPGYKDNRNLELGSITRTLKLLAKQLGIVIILLSQLNRDLEKRKDRRPRLADLRDSGSIEQDADMVLFTYRDEYYNPNTSKIGIMEMIVAKNRHGITGACELYYEANISLIASLARDNEQGWR